MNPLPPPGWVRVLVRPVFKNDLAPLMDRLGGEWNELLGAWVVEPGPSMHLARNPTTGCLENIMAPDERLRVELAVRDLRGLFTIEWQTSGPSALPRSREDVQPVSRTDRGWVTPKWEDPR